MKGKEKLLDSLIWVKICGEEGEKGKGSWWQLDAGCSSEFAGRSSGWIVVDYKGIKVNFSFFLSWS